MAFDERLAERIRYLLGAHTGLTEKKMFGGIAFLLNGNMCCGVIGDEMIVRHDPERTGDFLAEQHTRLFDMTGRPMKGWIMIAPSGLAGDRQIFRWIKESLAYTAHLPPK